MQLIVTHETADFDALASAVAAQRLYPDAAILMAAGVGREVHGYLALHRDRFRLVRREEVNADAVDCLVLVDVRRASRLGVVADLLARRGAGLEVHVYDHHGASEDDVEADLEVIEPVGSATTLLVEALRSRALELDSAEATLFVLGIYTDTRCLTFANSTARDARAVAWLLERGAELRVVNRYLRTSFSAAQRAALRELLREGAIEVVRVRGLLVGFGLVDLDEAPNGLAEVTEHAAELEPLHALVALYRIGDRRVQVVARSRSPLLDVGAAVRRAVGGGGHAAAASATVKGGDAASVRAAILAELESHTRAPLRVGQLMSSPVYAVAPDTPVAEVRAALRARGHSGAPVLRDGELVGIVSRRDLAGAAERGQLALPVASCMSQHKLYTVPYDAPVEEAIRRMTEGNVGRLPVMRRGRVVGIVTRSDALATLYPERDAQPEAKP